MGSWGATGSADLERLAIAYREGGRKIRSAMAKGLRAPANPLAEAVVKQGAEKMPRRGGLSERIAASRGGVTVSLLGQRVSVSLRMKTVEGYDLRTIDRKGIIRHPVFGNRKVWNVTKVEPHAFTDVFNEGAPEVRQAVLTAIRTALAEIAREASSP